MESITIISFQKNAIDNMIFVLSFLYFKKRILIRLSDNNPRTMNGNLPDRWFNSENIDRNISWFDWWRWFNHHHSSFSLRSWCRSPPSFRYVVDHCWNNKLDWCSTSFPAGHDQVKDWRTL